MPYTYNPATGQWTKSESPATTKATTPSSSPTSNNSSSGGGSNKSGNTTSKNSSSKTSAGKVEKANNYIELNTLEGTLNYIVTKETIKLRAGDTVKLKGLGVNLSGNYYVKSVTRQFSTRGYSNSAVLVKTDMGEVLKIKTKKLASVASVTVTSEGGKLIRTYTVKKGDTLKSIAKKFYGKNTSKEVKKIKDANKKVLGTKNTVEKGQKLIIP